MMSRRSPLARFLNVGGNSETTDSQTSASVIAAQRGPEQPRSSDTTTRLSVEDAIPAGVLSVYAWRAQSAPIAPMARLASSVPSRFSRLTRRRPANPAEPFAQSEPRYVVEGATATP